MLKNGTVNNFMWMESWSAVMAGWVHPIKSLLSTHNPISMENSQTPVLRMPQKRVKGLKTKDVKALHRTGMSCTAIADHLGVTPGTISYHLKKKRAPRSTDATEVKSTVSTSDKFAFEVNLYGVSIKLQQRPTAIEQRENAILIS